MGLIKAGMGALGGTLADQWKEFFYCDALDKDVLMVKGQKRTSRRSSNNGEDNIITNGSGIAVADGQCMLIVEQGCVVEVCAEPGEYTFNSSTEPSVFTGNFGDSLAATFQTVAKRFTYGGDTGKDQRVYYINTKELGEILYLGEQMTPDMADGDYAAAFRTFIQWTDAYVTAAREGHPYDVDNMPKEPFSIVYLGVALVIGLITALIVTGVMKSRLKSVAPQRDATSYVRQGSMKLTNQRDLYLYREVHRTERPKESSSSDSGGSSTHTSSSGSTHGGGGGSF